MTVKLRALARESQTALTWKVDLNGLEMSLRSSLTDCFWSREARNGDIASARTLQRPNYQKQCTVL